MIITKNPSYHYNNDNLDFIVNWQNITMRHVIANTNNVNVLLLTADAYLLNHPNTVQYWQSGNINNY